MVASVPNTPTSPLRVTLGRRLRPGSTAPSTPTGSSARSPGSAAADAVLQAISSNLTSWRKRKRRIARIFEHRTGAACPIRNPRGVAQIDDVFVRQPRQHRRNHRQSADARVKHTDRSAASMGHQFTAWGSASKNGAISASKRVPSGRTI